MQPVDYVVQQHGVRLSPPVKAYDKWMNRIAGGIRPQPARRRRTLPRDPGTG